MQLNTPLSREEIRALIADSDSDLEHETGAATPPAPRHSSHTPLLCNPQRQSSMSMDSSLRHPSCTTLRNAASCHVPLTLVNRSNAFEVRSGNTAAVGANTDDNLAGAFMPKKKRMSKVSTCTRNAISPNREDQSCIEAEDAGVSGCLTAAPKQKRPEPSSSLLRTTKAVSKARKASLGRKLVRSSHEDVAAQGPTRAATARPIQHEASTRLASQASLFSNVATPIQGAPGLHNKAAGSPGHPINAQESRPANPSSAKASPITSSSKYTIASITADANATGGSTNGLQSSSAVLKSRRRKANSSAALSRSAVNIPAPHPEKSAQSETEMQPTTGSAPHKRARKAKSAAEASNARVASPDKVDKFEKCGTKVGVNDSGGRRSVFDILRDLTAPRNACQVAGNRLAEAAKGKCVLGAAAVNGVTRQGDVDFKQRPHSADGNSEGCLASRTCVGSAEELASPMVCKLADVAAKEGYRQGHGLMSCSESERTLSQSLDHEPPCRQQGDSINGLQRQEPGVGQAGGEVTTEWTVQQVCSLVDTAKAACQSRDDGRPGMCDSVKGDVESKCAALIQPIQKTSAVVTGGCPAGCDDDHRKGKDTSPKVSEGLVPTGTGAPAISGCASDLPNVDVGMKLKFLDDGGVVDCGQGLTVAAPSDNVLLGAAAAGDSTTEWVRDTQEAELDAQSIGTSPNSKDVLEADGDMRSCSSPEATDGKGHYYVCADRGAADAVWQGKANQKRISNAEEGMRQGRNPGMDTKAVESGAVDAWEKGDESPEMMGIRSPLPDPQRPSKRSRPAADLPNEMARSEEILACIMKGAFASRDHTHAACGKGMQTDSAQQADTDTACTDMAGGGTFCEDTAMKTAVHLMTSRLPCLPVSITHEPELSR
jgi:hypothetical protein